MPKKALALIIVTILPLLTPACASTGPSAGTVAIEPATSAPPKPAELILGVGDSLDILIYRHDEMKTTTKINPSGKIMFPLIGEVQAAGQSVSALREELTRRFSKYFVDPQITLNVTSIQSQKVLVLGEVKNPGLFSLDADITLMDAVAKAGGWTTDARTSSVLLLRNVGGKVQSWAIDIDGAIQSGDLSQMTPLQRNDVVYVPPKKIADVARFMGYISTILSPIVKLEGGIVLWPQMMDALQGKTSGSVAIPAQ